MALARIAAYALRALLAGTIGAFGAVTFSDRFALRVALLAGTFGARCYAMLGSLAGALGLIGVAMLGSFFPAHSVLCWLIDALAGTLAPATKFEAFSIVLPRQQGGWRSGLLQKPGPKTSSLI